MPSQELPGRDADQTEKAFTLASSRMVETIVVGSRV